MFHTWTEVVVRSLVTIGYLVATPIALIRKKHWGFWFAWALIALGITLVPIKIAWIVAERYAYLAYIGFCVAAALLFERIVAVKKWEVAGIYVGIIVVIALSTRTMLRSSEWKSEDTLWVATLRESPEDPKSWNNIGDVYRRQGKYEASIAAFTQATELNPNYADAYHNIGNSYALLNKLDEAEPYFKKALSIKPDLWQSYQDLAGIAAEKGDYQQALQYIKQALAINPTDPVLQKFAQQFQRAAGGK
jgi:tetratricopeptide (TPR) repeat protein